MSKVSLLSLKYLLLWLDVNALSIISNCDVISSINKGVVDVGIGDVKDVAVAFRPEYSTLNGLAIFSLSDVSSVNVSFTKSIASSIPVIWCQSTH